AQDLVTKEDRMAGRTGSRGRSLGHASCAYIVLTAESGECYTDLQELSTRGRCRCAPPCPEVRTAVRCRGHPRWHALNEGEGVLGTAATPSAAGNSWPQKGRPRSFPGRAVPTASTGGQQTIWHLNCNSFPSCAGQHVSPYHQHQVGGSKAQLQRAGSQ